MLVSKPIVSSRIYRAVSLVAKRISGRKEGDRKAGRSAYNEQSGGVEKVLAMELWTESCLQVYLSCMQLTARNNVLQSFRLKAKGTC